MLSRATSLDHLILVGPSDRVKELLEAGPPAYIRKELRALQQAAARTEKLAERAAQDIGIPLPT